MTPTPERLKPFDCRQDPSSHSRIGGQPQKGIITFGLAPNRQNPLAGAAHDAVFNTWRRFYSQVFYWSIPAFLGYLIIDWANKR